MKCTERNGNQLSCFAIGRYWVQIWKYYVRDFLWIASVSPAQRSAQYLTSGHITLTPRPFQLSTRRNIRRYLHVVWGADTNK